jgi:ABC-2 type transport system ATP-binding protein
VLSEVRRICDRVGIIRAGELVELEDFETLLGQGGKHVRIYTTDDATEALAALDGVVEVSSFSDGVQFIYTGEYNALLDELAKHDVSDIEISEPPLEDVFIHYYGGAGAEETDREMDTDV